MNIEKKNSNKCPICGRPIHKESKYCIFHAKPKEKAKEEFMEALKKYIQEIKEGNKDCNFEGFIFIGEIDFKEDLNITIFKEANFFRATFEGNTSFRGVIFDGDADFREVTFKRDAIFSGVTFKGDTDFSGATFRGDTDFREVIFKNKTNFTLSTFQSYIYFMSTTFQNDVYLREAIFKMYADFRETTFNGYADFREVTFQGDADFTFVIFQDNTIFESTIFEEYTTFASTVFKKNADFTNVNFKKNIVLKGTTFFGDVYFNYASYPFGITLYLKVEGNGIVSFVYSNLANISLNLELGESVLIDFANSLFGNTKINLHQFENHILQEVRKKFFEARNVYLNLKNNFHSIGKYYEERLLHKKEKDMQKLSYSFYSYKLELKKKMKKEHLAILKWVFSRYFGRWFIFALEDLIYGYGERPWNVVRTAVIIVLMFAILFNIFGIGNPEIIELKGEIHSISRREMTLNAEGIIKNTKITQFPQSLYFSLVTFTTLGYGDLRPLEGAGRIVAGLEAFIGAFLIALFVHTFARRI